MTNQILVPSLGESIVEATVSKWLKQVGEKVDADEPVVELETDKVNIECTSPCSGTLSAIKKSGQYENFSFLSTGGGAFLKWLEKFSLPGIEILKKN